MNNCVKFTVVNILLITEGSDEMAKLLSSVSKKKEKEKRKPMGKPEKIFLILLGIIHLVKHKYLQF